MIAIQRNDYPNLTAISVRAQSHFGKKLCELDDGPKLEKYLRESRALIETMLLDADDFDVAVARINNARRYVRSNEFGAAKYELKLMIRRIQSRLRLFDTGAGESSADRQPRDTPELACRQ